MQHTLNRREALGATAGWLAGDFALDARGATAAPQFRLAKFSADVTPPLGHPLLAGLAPAVQAVDDPLFAKGLVLSADFPGLARRRRQADDPELHQVYVSGASGNVTVGKYNDGNPLNRPRLADRLYQAMVAAWRQTKRRPLTQVEFRSAPLRLEPRESPGFTVADLDARLSPQPTPRHSAWPRWG